MLNYRQNSTPTSHNRVLASRVRVQPLTSQSNRAYTWRDGEIHARFLFATRYMHVSSGHTLRHGVPHMHDLHAADASYGRHLGIYKHY